MKLTDEQKRKLQSHLNTKLIGSNYCPICKLSALSVSDIVFELRDYQGGDMVVGNIPIIPLIPITCTNCGNTILINGKVAKIVE